MSTNSPKPSMHVLMTTDVVGGVWAYTVQLCRALASSGIHISVAVLGPPTQRWHRQELKNLYNVSLFEGNFKLEWMDDSERDVQASGEWLLALAQNQRVDLVHLNGYMHAAMGWQVPALVVAHSCLLSWWAAVKKTPVPASFDGYRERVRRGLQAASLVAAPSRAMLDAITVLYSPFRESMVIPNGRSAREFPAGKKEPFVLSSGRLWDEGKNLRLLEKIAPQLPWPVYLAGERKHPNGSTTDFRNVVMLGALPRPEMQPWFSRAAIYAAPAVYEPFGLSVLEAALAGCALVLNDIPSLRENWEGAATFADGEDDFRAAILRLIEDEHARRRCSALCAARAVQFAPRIMGRRYLEAYARAHQLYRANTELHERVASCA